MLTGITLSFSNTWTHSLLAIPFMKTNMNISFVFSNPPGSNYDFFTFQVIDSSGAPSSIATCNIIVNPVNDPPVSQNWTQAGSEDVPQLVDFMPYISDVDNDLSSLTVIITSLPQNGQLFTSSDGGVTFTQPITNIGMSHKHILIFRSGSV